MSMGQILQYVQGFITQMGLTPFIFAAITITLATLGLRVLIGVFRKD